jgi:hypothetical protein
MISKDSEEQVKEEEILVGLSTYVWKRTWVRTEKFGGVTACNGVLFNKLSAGK